MKIFLSIVLLLISCISHQLADTTQTTTPLNKPIVVCYWASWRLSWLKPESIDPTLCTHLHHAFHVLDVQNNVVRDSTGSPQPDIYRRLNQLKLMNPDLKLIVSLGGAGQPDRDYSELISDKERRLKFINNTIDYLNKYQFDGLDIDWEYPVCWSYDCSKGPESDRPNFGIFLKELRSAFDKQSPRPLSLSAAVIAGLPGGPADHAYDFPSMASALDYVSVMTYAGAGEWDHKTGHHSKFTFCLSGTQYYVDKGIPKHKLLMGVPISGTTFKLADKTKHGIGAPIQGMGHTPHGLGDCSMYSEMCELVKQANWTKETSAQGGHDPIAYKDLIWVGYDDPYAAYDKSKWVKDNGFGGIIVWEITMDDFKPSCCSVRYPMLRAINYGLYGSKGLGGGGGGPETYGCEHK
ncbi:probable chitinase 10 [Oppia nitens]|uniref:probable chitinase 10 n=1 Tax=Oppia nitens TaxID=1686743 RepID=UPI0023DA846D|nr:probable chitinase 10 [Oppia nitens]